MAKEYSLSQVKKHNNNQGAWVVIHNEIFDVTSFLNEVSCYILFFIYKV